ncbi:MAG TPA: ATP-dependent chaperone ClpB, partial [Planctomycetes bacterium]|nr:ATP-dependent chaperone ClpB [Planctomycetota bacterium]
MQQLPFTNRSTEAIQAAQALATESGHPELTSAHLCAALLEQPEGVLAALLGKLEADPKVLRAEVERILERMPRQSGASPQPAAELGAVLQEAGDRAKKLGDEYLSTEHLLLAIASRGGG